jgi:hypothetical protein
MKNKKSNSQFDLEQMKRWKNMKPESKFQWLSDALEFVRATRPKLPPNERNF